jgi:hypothetical protein
MRIFDFPIKLRLFLGIILWFTSINAKAQEVSPSDGSTLNYTQIMFEVPFYKEAKQYQIQLSVCDNRAENCKEVTKVKSKNRAFILDEPIEFGKTYRWQYMAIKGNKTLYTSNKFTFYTANHQLLDTNLQKLVFTKAPKKKSDGILIIDGLKLVTDMQGKPLLYLNYRFDHSVRDINLTPQGTLTLVDNRLGEVKEMKLNGEMIWIGPTKHEDTEGRSDKYHHEFEKLNNGNYLAAGKKKVSDFDETAGLKEVPGETLCETIVEFDKEQNEVWRFNLLPELKRQYHIAPDVNMFNPTRLGHLNGMAVDEKNQIVYASFKTFNTVMKIDKNSNNILYQYGLKKINFKDSTEKGLTFEQQHAPIFNSEGNLLIFNNGNPLSGSGITELKVGSDLNPNNEVVKSIYFKEYFTKDTYAPQMGSVQETGKNKYLVCMGSVPHFFEMDGSKKKLLWQAYTYQNTRFYEGGKIWRPLHSYRIRKYSSLFPYYYNVDTYKKGKNDYLNISNSGSEKVVLNLILITTKNQKIEKRVIIEPKKNKSIIFNGFKMIEIRHPLLGSRTYSK